MAEQAAWVLNCHAHNIPALVATKLIKPLANPPANSIKFFATADLLEAAKTLIACRVCRAQFTSIGKGRMAARKTQR